MNFPFRDLVTLTKNSAALSWAVQILLKIMDRILLNVPEDEPDDDYDTVCRVVSPQNIM